MFRSRDKLLLRTLTSPFAGAASELKHLKSRLLGSTILPVVRSNSLPLRWDVSNNTMITRGG
jgi:hypothetical protein